MEQENFNEYYNITKEIKKDIPIWEKLDDWVKIAFELKNESRPNIMLYTLKDLRDELIKFIQIQKVQYYPTLDDFNKEFNLPSPRDFFIKLFYLIDDLFQKKIIDSGNFIDDLLLDQTDSLGPWKRKYGYLSIDEDIPDDLKDIAEKVGRGMRAELVNKEFAEFHIVKNHVKDRVNSERVIENLISDRKYWPDEQIRDEDWNEKLSGWIELFRWCVLKGKLVERFPLISKDKKRYDLKDLNEDAFVIPFKYMGVDDKFEEIYPEKRIMHKRYFEIDNQEELRNLSLSLGHYKSFVTHLPVYRKEKTFAYNKLKSVLTSIIEVSKVHHRVVSNSEGISEIPLWNEVIGNISEFQDRAKLLFEFVAKHVIGADQSWESEITTGCSCGEKTHRIRPSFWLASLKTDDWIPVRITQNDIETIVKREATKESIESLFDESELDDLISNYRDKITTLLTHFGYDELDLKIRLESIDTGKDKSAIRKDISKLV